jgi:tetratricopeptide (TPR) repeat protein
MRPDNIGCQEAKMKKHFAFLLFALLVLGLCVSPVFAQSSGTVKGVCKDADGKPIADAIVVYANLDNGQKYTLKTNKKGEYFSLGITPGKYNVTLYKNADDEKAGKEADHVNGFQVQLDENNLDLDMKKEMEQAAKSAGMSAEQMKQKEQEQAKVQKENTTIKSLNEKLVAAKTAADGGDYDTAIADLVAANQIDPNRDLIWFKLGDYYRMSALKQTDTAEKQKRLDSAIESYQKAVEIRKATPPDPKDPTTAAKNLAAYYNNLADAYAKDRKVDDAAKTYELAAAADPSSAASAYFNEGAVLTNAGRPDDANAAFDKCLAADPNRVEAYYQKGVNLLGKATLQGNKTVPAPGTVEALQKYLELAPNGPNAQSAKDLLASLGSPVETSFGKKKQTSKTK